MLTLSPLGENYVGGIEDGGCDLIGQGRISCHHPAPLSTSRWYGPVLFCNGSPVFRTIMSFGVRVGLVGRIQVGLHEAEVTRLSEAP
ncbi:hypothetical protein MBT84_38965 [Streptomyces sp. MBT84]|nr:hypothetical protein [Streptomyces sp. MBT84]